MNAPFDQSKWGGKGRFAALFCFLFACVSFPGSLFACAACYGQSDSAMAKGMNMGIFSLLGVIVAVLGGIAGFFVYLAKRSAQSSAGSELAHLPEPDRSPNV